jgi:preprotein translocase subunit Sec63
MNDTQALATLKAAMLSAQTLGELYALMEVYSYQEFMHIYEQLPSQEQAAIDMICDRDNQIQMAAITMIPV